MTSEERDRFLALVEQPKLSKQEARELCSLAGKLSEHEERLRDQAVDRLWHGGFRDLARSLSDRVGLV